MIPESRLQDDPGVSWQPADRMRRLIKPWLRKPDTDPAVLDQLALWLQGSGLPPFGDDEPYVWILMGLESAGALCGEDGQVCQRVARLLDERQPDVEWPGLRPEEGLYNLLHLCSRLKCPTTLAEPLWRLYRRGKIRGSHRGLDLRGALAIALMFNQVDDRLRETWRDLLEFAADSRPRPRQWGGKARARPTAASLGGPHTGFSGLLWMPPASGRLGEPSREDIRFGLTRMAAYLDAKPNPMTRRSVFRDLLLAVHQAHERANWNERFYEWADADRWPEWAVFCNRPFVPRSLDQPSEAASLAYAWDGLAYCVFDEPDLLDAKRLCHDRVYEIPLGNQRDLIDGLSVVADQMEQQFPKMSPQAIDFKTIWGICQHMIYAGADEMQPIRRICESVRSRSGGRPLRQGREDPNTQSLRIPSPVGFQS